WLMTYRGEWIGLALRRLSWVHATLAMDLIELLGAPVVGREVAVGERPGGGHAILVADFAEIPLAHPQQPGPVEFGIAADEVVYARMERAALLVVPGFLGLVLVVDENGLAIPVVVLPRQIAATLEQQDLLAGRGQLVCERAAARTRAYDD